MKPTNTRKTPQIMDLKIAICNQLVIFLIYEMNKIHLRKLGKISKIA